MPRDFHSPVSPGLRFMAIALLSWLTLLAAMPTAAQDLDPNSPPPVRDHVSCGHFESRADAQEVLDAGDLDEPGRQSLDNDGDGIACEDAFLDADSPPPARDYVSCGHFDSQHDAQDALDSGNLDEPGVQSLDDDGDGIACEDAFDSGAAEAAPTSVVGLPNTGTGPAEGPSRNSVMLTNLIVASGGMLLLSRRFAVR